MSGFLSVGYFLVSLFFNLVLFLLWMRIFLRLAKISSLHPVSQSINSITDSLVKPIDNFLAKSKKRSSYDWTSFVAILIVDTIKYLIIGLLLYKSLIPFGYLLLFIFSDLIVQPCNLLFYMILIRAIMSFVNPMWTHPAEEVLRIITEPLLSFVRGFIPPFSGIDLSPLIILILLEVITLFMNASLPLRLA